MEEVENKHQKLIQYYKMLDKYFKTKQSYDKKYQGKIEKVLKLSNINNRFSKKKYNTLDDKLKEIKLKCIGCNENVGTIFENTENEYIAICGDRSNPCNLDINIKKIKVIDSYELENELQKNKNQLEKLFIIAKFDDMFDFISKEELVELFDKIKEEFSNNNSQIDFLKEYINSLENKEEIINNLKENKTLFYQNVKELKEIIKEYLETNKNSLLNDSIDIYNKILNYQNLINQLEYSFINQIGNEHKKNDKIIYNTYKYKNLIYDKENDMYFSKNDYIISDPK